jgi:hypothetical protein
LGNFLSSKEAKPSYLTTVEFYSSETPSSWNYTPKPMKNKYKKGWSRPSTPEIPKKKEIGPGTYADGVSKSYKLITKSTVSHSFSRSNSPSPLYQRAYDTKEIPGVGFYQDVEKVYTNNRILKKNRTPVILPYKHKGFLDIEIQKAKGVPGVGAYHIGPPKKIY